MQLLSTPRPACTYTLNSIGPGFRVDKERTNGSPSQHDARFVDGHRVQRLEARVDQIMDAVNTLVELQSGHDSTAQPTPSSPRLTNTPNQLDQRGGQDDSITSRRHISSSDIPNEVLQELVKLYADQLADQPLPLFDSRTLSSSVRTFSSALMMSFLALTIRRSVHGFFGNAQVTAAASYRVTASRMLFSQAADATVDLETLQAFCLLCLGEIADGNSKRAWMALGVAARLAVCSGLMLGTSKANSTSPEHSRCCWSLFILDRIHGGGFRSIPAIPAEAVLPEMPPSPRRPDNLALSSPNDIEEGQTVEEKDAGIFSYALRLLSIWGRLMAYLKTIRQGVVEDAWSANSVYQQIKSEMSRFETVLPEVHRFKNTKFRDIDVHQLEQNRHYWACWVFTQCVYHTIHCTLNHPFLHIARIPGRKTPRSPSFLQHATDQALLHSAWVVLILTSCEERHFKIYDPFIGHLASMIATAQFLLQFSKDEALAARAARNFETLRGFVEKMAVDHPHLLHIVSKLNRLAHFAITHSQSNAAHPPKVETALLWDLLDYAASASPNTYVSDASDNVELNVNTQFLSPVNPDMPRLAPLAPLGDDAYGTTNLWDDATFVFDMADFSNVADFSGLQMPNEGWMGGHL